MFQIYKLPDDVSFVSIRPKTDMKSLVESFRKNYESYKKNHAIPDDVKVKFEEALKTKKVNF